ncbi:MAG TPA: hypothetical protein VIG24_17160 [Acidimicrobiia bacterium]
MTNDRATLDDIVSRVSEMTDDQLISMQSMLERAHVHVMIERALREGDRVSGTIRSLRSG